MSEIKRLIPDLERYKIGLRGYSYDGSLGKQRQLYQTLDEIFDPLPKNLDARQATHMLFEVLNFFDPYTAQHSEELAQLSDFVAPSVFCRSQRIDSPYVNVETLRNAALLHDIGKIGILSLLDKPVTKGLSLEFRKLHAYFTRHILRKFLSLREIEPIASAVHVRSKELSYPEDIRWDDVRIEARILAIVDALHSITHNRPGDPAQSRTTALNIIRKNGYDQDIVEIIADILSEIPVDLIPNV